MAVNDNFPLDQPQFRDDKAITGERLAKINKIFNLLMSTRNEVERATDLYPPMHSAHEGYAVLKEEVDEVWDEVKQKHPDFSKMRKELVQVAAMALRMALDICDPETPGGDYENKRAVSKKWSENETDGS